MSESEHSIAPASKNESSSERVPTNMNESARLREPITPNDPPPRESLDDLAGMISMVLYEHRTAIANGIRIPDYAMAQIMGLVYMKSVQRYPTNKNSKEQMHMYLSWAEEWRKESNV